MVAKKKAAKAEPEQNWGADDRQTFEAPEGTAPVLDDEGRATGELFEPPAFLAGEGAEPIKAGEYDAYNPRQPEPVSPEEREPSDNARPVDGRFEGTAADPEEEPAKRGRGRPKTAVPDVDMGGNEARSQLISFVERFERLAEEKQAISDDIKELSAEFKGTGFNLPILKEVLRRRKMDAAARDEHDALLEIYEESIR